MFTKPLTRLQRQITDKLHEHRGSYWKKGLSWTILEEQFPVSRNTAASKMGNGVILLLWQLRCHCNPDNNKFSSLSNTTVVAIFPHLCFVYGYVVYAQGIDPEKLYRATLTFCCFILFIKASAESASPSNSFLKTVDEVEKSVYESQALESFYVQSPARLKKIEKIIVFK